MMISGYGELASYPGRFPMPGYEASSEPKTNSSTSDTVMGREKIQLLLHTSCMQPFTSRSKLGRDDGDGRRPVGVGQTVRKMKEDTIHAQ